MFWEKGYGEFGLLSMGREGFSFLGEKDRGVATFLRFYFV